MTLWCTVHNSEGFRIPEPFPDACLANDPQRPGQCHVESATVTVERSPMTTCSRDQYEQLTQPWTETHYQIINILEEVQSDTNPDRTLAAYMTDILEILSQDICECGCNEVITVLVPPQADTLGLQPYTNEQASAYF